ncbi:lactate utilization protein [Sphingobacteriales bacterium UPWRP_1]|nr:[Fe-S]-binding protein [Sphingobacteriales bacterium TSM_CSS]PSJ72180.1 lactate utilization protein [Sphingobacteriales bacterium UPWRP_1]
MSKKAFLKAATLKVADEKHRQTIAFNMGKYDAAVAKGKQNYLNLPAARRYAKNIKWQAIENLPQYLTQFERNFTQRGGKVIWAETAQQAAEAVLQILQQHNVKGVVKSKSMATEEIHLNERLEQSGITVFETDLGEFIVQLSGEKPYHIVTPAMHKSRADVALLFNRLFNTPLTATAEDMTQTARRQLRPQYTQCEAGITGANFLLADIGAIAITENEGNARLTTALPRIHIVIAGIEKVLPSVKDLAHFWPLLATHGTGQQVTVYNTILTGPKQVPETEGPEAMYVILLDNGRSAMLANPKLRQALYCIRCGACLNACPVYRQVGGHTYQSAYSGPIGSVIAPYIGTPKERNHYQHLSHASSLCGRCTEVCPVNIPLHQLLLYNRRKMAAIGGGAFTERLAWALWKKAMLNPNLLRATENSTGSRLFRAVFGRMWGRQRSLPQLPPKSFNTIWQEQQTKYNTANNG